MKVPDVIDATFNLGYRKGFADAIHEMGRNIKEHFRKKNFLPESVEKAIDEVVEKMEGENK